MDSSKKYLAELFGVVAYEESDGASASKKKGRNAKESAELGNLAQNQGHIEAAIEHFERAREQSDGKSAKPLIDLAATYELAGREEEAQALMAEAATGYTDEAEPRVGLSEVYKRNARFKDAVDELERAIATEPNNPLYHFKLAELCWQTKLYKDALRSAERASLCAPDNAFFHFWLGDLLIEMKQFSEALEPFKNALTLSPGEDHYVLRASVALWGAGKKLEAIKAVRMASDLVPDNTLYPRLLNFYLKQHGEPEIEIKGEVDPYDTDLVARIAAQLDLEP